MKLSAYLELNGIKRSHFARLVAVTPGRITQLCDYDGWPGKELAEEIAKHSKGMVTADDFTKARRTYKENVK